MAQPDPQHTHLSIPSSPYYDLPSPTVLLRKTSTVIKTGSHAAEIPTGAATGFTSASKYFQEPFVSNKHLQEASTAAALSPVYQVKGSKDSWSTKATTKTMSKSNKTKPNTSDPQDSRNSTKSCKGKANKQKASTVAEDNDVSAIEIPESPQAVGTRSVPPPYPISPNRKERVSEAVPNRQTKIRKGRVTKPKGERNVKKPSTAGKASSKGRSIDTVSKTFDQDSETSLPNTTKEAPDARSRRVSSTKTLNEDEPLLLDQAIPRRTDWTPPKEPTKPQKAQQATKTSSSIGDIALKPIETQSAEDSFSKLTEIYNYDNKRTPPVSVSPERSPRMVSGESFTKKRRLDLVSYPSLQAPSPPKSDTTTANKPKTSKSTKKKARTITDAATAKYRPLESAPAPTTAPSETDTVSSFFAPRQGQTTESAAMVHTNASDENAPKKKRQRKLSNKESQDKPGKEKKKRSTKAKPVSARKKLLSPSAALKKAGRQEILFGTSSQLVGEESPTTLRQFQQALRESEADAPISESGQPESSRIGLSTSLIKASRGLWSAAARDFDNSVVCIEDNTPKKPEEQAAKNEETGFVHIDDAMDKASSPQPKEQDKVTSEKEAAGSTRSGLSTEHGEADGKNQSKQELPNISKGSITEMTKPLGDIQSRAALQPLDNNSKAKDSKVSKYAEDLKNTKDSENSKVSEPKVQQGPEPEAKQHTTAAASPTGKRPRGRPRKDPSAPPKPQRPRKKPTVDAVTSTSTPTKKRKRAAPKKSAPEAEELHDINDDISDLEPAPTPSPPRRSASQPPLSIYELELISTSTTTTAKATQSKVKSTKLRQPKEPAPFTSTSNSAELGPINDVEREIWPSLAPRLFPAITAAVKAQPRTQDLKNPSWWEKILMYDPIILDDLSEWLKGQLRGDTKEGDKDEGGDDGKARVEGFEPKWLKVWMVQRWCEENSICCILKDGRWKRRRLQRGRIVDTAF
ncbi:MAG: 5'-flap endonuclease [Bogoriella megaspora]|nr:MAG: 5'-flap endonuclease [Bogoriella megaspora]